MVVLAKDIRISFELDPNKVDAFFEKSDKTAFNRAMARASLHKSDKERRETLVKCISSDVK